MKHFLRLQVAVLVFLFSLSERVMAALPTAADITTGTGTTATASPIQMVIDFVTSGAGIIATVICATVAFGAGFAMYQSFIEARQKEEWKKFVITSVAGLFVIVITIVLALLGVEYATA